MSVCEINQIRLYDKETEEPLRGGLSDPRMGTTSRGHLCETCSSDMIDCPGHFGHITL